MPSTASPPPAAPPAMSDVIPRDVITGWLEGKYHPGPQRPESYEPLGWALMLRGCYFYLSLQEDSAKSLQTESWGYALFDLRNGELYAAGVRLYSAPFVAGPIRDAPHPLLWRTEVCKVKSRGRDKSLMTIYCLAFDKGSKAAEVHARFQGHFIGGANAAGPSQYNPLHLPDALRQEAVQYLQGRFDHDWNELEKSPKCTYGVFEMGLKTFKDTEPVEFTGQYRNSGSSTPSGTATFQRIF